LRRVSERTTTQNGTVGECAIAIRDGLILNIPGDARVSDTPQSRLEFSSLT
jgi:hypothetical protein